MEILHFIFASRKALYNLKLEVQILALSMYSGVLQGKLPSSFLTYLLLAFVECIFCFPKVNVGGTCLRKVGTYNHVITKSGAFGDCTAANQSFLLYRSVLVCNDNEFKGWCFSGSAEKIIRLLYSNDGILASVRIW